MKKTILLMSGLLFNSLLFSQPKVFVNYVTHNEDGYDQYVNNQAFYIDARTMLRQFAIDCNLKGAKWSMGNDFKMLDAVLLHDIGLVTSNTNNLNLLKWLQDFMDVEMDPHAHAQFGSPSLADVAYKHTLLGVVPSSVISGYLMSEADGNDKWWFDYELPVQSNMNPSYSYHPEILWGAATPGHVNDPFYYGIWKPSDTLNYYTHKPQNRLINYGNGCRIKIKNSTTVSEVLTTVDSLLDGLQDGSFPNDGFYQISFFISEYYFWDDEISPNVYSFDGGFLSKVNEITDSINNRVSQNLMEWMHIEDIVEEWKTSYNSEPFFVSCDGGTVLTIKDSEIIDGINVYPNPTSDKINVSLMDKNEIYDFILYDLNGKILYQINEVVGGREFSLDSLKKGMYFVQVTYKKEVVTTKVIVN